MVDFFENIDEEKPEDTNIRSFHSVIKKKDDKVLLSWLNHVRETLTKQGIDRNQRQRSHLIAYRGTQYMNKRATPRDNEAHYKTTRIDKFMVNHLYDLTETKVSQMTRLKPAVEVMPNNDEFADKIAAKSVKMLVNHVWYNNDIDDIIRKLHRNKFIMGESYLFIEWDAGKGDLHPSIVNARNLGEPLYQVDEAGNYILDDNEERIPLPEKLKIGDVKYGIEMPWRVLLQRKRCFEDVEYAFRISTEDVDTLKKKYPSKAETFKVDTDVKQFDYNTLENRALEEEMVVFEFFHKYTELVEEGYYVKFTKDAILEQRGSDYTHGDLPFERLTDLDIPDILNGVSRYEMCRPIQNMHNNLSTLLAKNIYLTGHAKWVMPRGACKIEALTNDNTIVQYQGPVAPQLLQVSPNPPEAYAYREGLKTELGQVFGVTGGSRGAPPPGITAGVALQFLNEQENERATSDIAKHNKLVERIARKTVSVCGDYYATDDGRMLRIVGKDNEYMLKHFDAANLSKSYDIKVNNSTALPESKPARLQRIIEMMQYNSSMLSSERWVDLLDLGNSEKMTSLITEAVKAADSENEDLLAGNPVGEPEEWEDHILHWRAHSKTIQRRSFKEETPVEIREAFIDHIETTEFAMFEKAKTSQLFQAKLAELPLFPIFYREGEVPKSREHQEAVVQGQANRGEDVTELIPGTEAAAGPGEPDLEKGDK